MAKTDSTMISCLSDERVEVRFLPKENSMAGNNPKHVLYGGMAETSTRTFVVPQLRSGVLVDVLTKSEKDFLEDYLGMEDNALSVHKAENNFWKRFQVQLRKDSNILDLSKGLDYIKYKVLLANTNSIAPSIQALQDTPKATYEFVLIREADATKAVRTKLDNKKEAYKELGKIEGDKDTLRVVVETLTRTPVSSSMSVDDLAVKVDEFIDRDAKTFLRVVQDEYLPTKVLIRNAIEAGVISNRGGQLYLREDGRPLCENGEPTMSVAAAYLNMPKNSELKLMVEAKVKQYKNNA